jgi:hypothetical protein
MLVTELEMIYFNYLLFMFRIKSYNVNYRHINIYIYIYTGSNIMHKHNKENYHIIIAVMKRTPWP